MRKQILLVEDNPDSTELTLIAFKECNIDSEITVVRDGAEALDYLFAIGKHAGRDPALNPDLVLLDLRLPRMSGVEVLQKIRQDERTRLVPVVMLTVSRETEDIARCYKAGANSYVRKPIEYKRYVSSLQQLCSYWLYVNEAPPPFKKPGK